MGWGGVTAVARATGMSRATIAAGLRELELPAERRLLEAARMRRPGAGRQAFVETDPGVARGAGGVDRTGTRGRSGVAVAVDLQEHAAAGGGTDAAGPSGRCEHRGDACCTRRATACKPIARPAKGAAHPDRNAQFEYINRCVKRFQKRGQPAISVDTKKKELVGDFKNGGREWRPQGEPEEVRVHDFLDKKLGKAIPYGVYDILNNQGWVNVGIDHDTAAVRHQQHPSLVEPDGPAPLSPRPRNCSSRPMAAAATVIVRGCGRCRCKNWPTSWA